MVVVCPERSEAERRATVCLGRLTIIAFMLFAVEERGFQPYKMQSVFGYGSGLNDIRICYNSINKIYIIRKGNLSLKA